MGDKKFAVIDAETDPFDFRTIPEPFIWGFYDGKNYRQFEKTRHLVSYIKKFDGNIYAHNGGKFDYHFLLDYAPRGQKVLVINGRLSKWKLGKATMLDSYNILPVPLKQLQKDDFDYSKMRKNKRMKYMDEIMVYLKNDCMYLWRHIDLFIHDYGQFITLASAAFNFWKQLETDKLKHYDEKEVFRPPRSNEQYYNDFLPYYFGGRVTPFKLGYFEKPLQMYDINSAYPYVMKNFKHPLFPKYYKTITPPRKDSDLINCFLKIKCDSDGALPIRTKKGISFPYSKNETFCCTGFEFVAGLKTNTIRKIDILECIRFEHLYSFDNYIDYFYEMKNKCKKTDAKYTFSKLMLNSLYGKFASNPANYSEYIFSNYGERPPLCEDMEGQIKAGFSPKCKHCDICQKWGVQNGAGSMQLFSRQLPESKRRFYNICTSASITGAVRAYLWEAINKVDIPYYCDTDSIICENGDNLNISKELGQWGLEGKANKLAIAGKKLYAIWFDTGKTKVASKGVDFTGTDIKRLTEGYCVIHKNKAPTFSIKKDPGFIERNIIGSNFDQKDAVKIYSENCADFS